MNRAIKSILFAGTIGLLLGSCGGGSNNTSTPTTKIKTRAFVSNSFYGALDIVDYAKQVQVAGSISAGSGASLMVLTPDRASTIVVNSAASTYGVSIVDNKTEAALATVMIPAEASSVVVSPDSKTAWIATRNAAASDSSGNPLQSGAVQVLDLVNKKLATQIPVGLAQTLALSPDGKKMLVFRDQSDVVSYIDVSVTTPAAVDVVGSPMSRPIGAVFSADGSKAYVVNCGPECGGSGAAGVSVLDMAAATPSASAVVPVDAGSTIFSDSSSLYVAGTKLGSSSGSLTVLSPNGATVAVSKGPIAIGGGFHTQIISASNNKLFIGARDCSDASGVAGAGCLTIYDTSASTAVVTKGGQGRVTGMAVVPNNNLVYVVAGGELLTYDTTTSGIFAGPCKSSSCFINIVGSAEDVKIIDQ